MHQHLHHPSSPVQSSVNMDPGSSLHHRSIGPGPSPVLGPLAHRFQFFAPVPRSRLGTGPRFSGASVRVLGPSGPSTPSALRSPNIIGPSVRRSLWIAHCPFRVSSTLLQSIDRSPPGSLLGRPRGVNTQHLARPGQRLHPLLAYLAESPSKW